MVYFHVQLSTNVPTTSEIVVSGATKIKSPEQTWIQIVGKGYDDCSF